MAVGYSSAMNEFAQPTVYEERLIAFVGVLGFGALALESGKPGADAAGTIKRITEYRIAVPVPRCETANHEKVVSPAR